MGMQSYPSTHLGISITEENMRKLGVLKEYEELLSLMRVYEIDFIKDFGEYMEEECLPIDNPLTKAIQNLFGITPYYEYISDDDEGIYGIEETEDGNNYVQNVMCFEESDIFKKIPTNAMLKMEATGINPEEVGWTVYN